MITSAPSEPLAWERDLLRLLDLTHDSFVFRDPEDHITFWSQGSTELYGWPSTEAVGKVVHTLLDTRFPEPFADIQVKLRETGVWEGEVLQCRRDGSRIAVASRWASHHDDADTILGTFESNKDITKRKSAEASIRQQMRQMQLLTDNAPVYFARLDAHGRYTFVNKSYAARFRLQPGDLIGRTAREILGAKTYSIVGPYVERALSGKRIEYEAELPGEEDRPQVLRCVYEPEFDANGRVEGMVAAIVNVTERRKLEEQLRQAQKMEAIGTLAGGVAHDFNNLLTVINGYSEVMLAKMSPHDPNWDALSQIHRAGEHAAALTYQLLAFSRRQVLEPRVLCLDTVVADTTKMIGRLLGEHVILSCNANPDLGQVKVDVGQMQQVLINLAVNARDAMPQGGKLTIEIRNVVLDESYARSHPEVGSGEYVLLAVSDSGHGMSDEVRQRIFEPFFTTKGHGHGTGLGLATVYGIVRQSGGTVEVYSVEGGGTTFKIYLPRVRAATPAPKTLHGPGAMPLGRETVLLAEDEEGVRQLAANVLRACGYCVIEASDGERATQVVEECEAAIDLLISDVVMPHLGGRQLAERVRVVKPKVKVLFLSGYTDDAIVRHGVLDAETPFLHKPFTPSALAKKVRQVLDS
jgi:PAS domain S-box-containing protein